MTDKLYDIATTFDNCLAADKFSCCCGILMFVAVTTCQALRLILISCHVIFIGVQRVVSLSVRNG